MMFTISSPLPRKKDKNKTNKHRHDDFTLCPLRTRPPLPPLCLTANALELTSSKRSHRLFRKGVEELKPSGPTTSKSRKQVHLLLPCPMAGALLWPLLRSAALPAANLHTWRLKAKHEPAR